MITSGNNKRKWSLLGLVLIAASAVTAAVLPKNQIDKEAAFNGSLTETNDRNDEYTCDITDDISNGCFASTARGSVTTVGLLSSSGTARTKDNTTLQDKE